MPVFLNRIRQSRLFRGFIATLLGSGASKVILIAATFLFTHLMTKMEFGEFSFVRNTLNTILCMSALNFTTLCTKFTVEANNESPYGYARLFQVFRFSLIICLTIGALLLITPTSILDRLFTSHRIAFSFKIIGLLLPIFILQPLIEGIMRGVEDFKLIGILQTITACLFVAFVFVGYKLGAITGAVIGVVVYYLVYAIISYIILARRYSDILVHIQQTDRNAERSVIRTMIVPIFLMSFFEAPVLWLAQVLLSHYGTMESVGSMTAIMQLRNLAILIPGYFASTFLTYASEFNAKGDYPGYFDQFQKYLWLFLGLGVIVFIIFSATSKPLLSLYGSAYVSDWPAMVIASLGIPVFMLLAILRIDLIVQEHQKSLFYISVVWNLLWLACLFVLLKLKCPPLPAFFISQLVGCICNLILYFIVYKQDMNLLK